MLLATIAMGQEATTGSLTGYVSSGGVFLLGLTVTLTPSVLQGSRTTNTNVNGDYQFASLPPGDYDVRFDLEGLESAKDRSRGAGTGRARRRRTSNDEGRVSHRSLRGAGGAGNDGTSSTPQKLKGGETTLRNESKREAAFATPAGQK